MMPWLVLALTLSQVELPPEARARPEVAAAAQPTVWTRALLSGGAGALAGGAALGLSWMLLSGNPSVGSFDPTFANAALGTLLISGVAFSVHQSLGGQGEVLLALLLVGATMAGTSALAQALDGSLPLTPILATAMGALPAAALAVLGLELTSPAPKTVAPVRLAVGPGALHLTF